MLSKLFSLFALISLLFSFHAESTDLHDLSLRVAPKVSTVITNLSATEFVSVNCEDCEESDFGDHSEHCSHHCSGLHNLAPVKNQAFLSTPTVINNNVVWLYYHQYKNPFLNPSVKPPMFSSKVSIFC
ncbi:hypothetical protein [Halobacteriovorax sp. HLS]|uniref:hypothetical protein n=1 Tax=Halobacteriovorax sp. HLS TaxID=2234000 RepID=UPI000FDABB0F|nr:hypothetical protein [Halobacteriovorax sp. HLS]